MSRGIRTAFVAGLIWGGVTVPAWANELTCWVETDQRQYTSGDVAHVDVVCDNRTDGEAVIIGHIVDYVGEVFGKDDLRKWDGTYVGSFGAHSDFGNDWIKYADFTPVRTEIHIPPRSKVVIATLWGGQEFGWNTDRIGTGQPLSPGDYVIDITLDGIRIKDAIGRVRDVRMRMTVPVKIGPK